MQRNKSERLREKYTLVYHIKISIWEHFATNSDFWKKTLLRLSRLSLICPIQLPSSALNHVWNYKTVSTFNQTVTQNQSTCPVFVALRQQFSKMLKYLDISWAQEGYLGALEKSNFKRRFEIIIIVGSLEKQAWKKYRSRNLRKLQKQLSECQSCFRRF